MKVRFYFQEIVSAEISRWDEHSVRYLFCQLLCLLFLFQQKRILLSRRTEQIQNKTIVNIWNTDRCDSFWNFYLIPHSFYMCQICIHSHLFHYCFRIYVMIFRESLVMIINVSKEMVWSSRPEITFSRLFKGWYGSLWILKPNT